MTPTLIPSPEPTATPEPSVNTTPTPEPTVSPTPTSTTNPEFVFPIENAAFGIMTIVGFVIVGFLLKKN